MAQNYEEISRLVLTLLSNSNFLAFSDYMNFELWTISSEVEIQFHKCFVPLCYVSHTYIVFMKRYSTLSINVSEGVNKKNPFSRLICGRI